MLNKTLQKYYKILFIPKHTYIKSHIHITLFWFARYDFDSDLCETHLPTHVFKTNQ